MIADAFTRIQTGADALVEGHYLIILARSRRVDIPVRVWFGPPCDPDTGEEMDRSPRWQVKVGFDMLAGEPVRVGPLRIEALSDIWPACARNPIDEAEYRYRMERASWAAQYDPEDPHGTVGGRIDPMTARLP